MKRYTRFEVSCREGPILQQWHCITSMAFCCNRTRSKWLKLCFTVSHYLTLITKPTCIPFKPAYLRHVCKKNAEDCGYNIYRRNKTGSGSTYHAILIAVCDAS